MSKRAVLIGFFLLLSAWTPAWGQRVECSAVPSKTLARSVRFCALLPASYDAAKQRRYPILYYLHGLGDNEQSLVNFGGWNMLENLQKKERVTEYLVVTPDGGRSFYVNSRDGRVRYEDFFIKEFLPHIEKRYRVAAGRRKRGIAGVSMGGYGALRFAFKYPRLFGSVSAHSAALMERLPQGLVSADLLGGRANVLGDVFGSPIDQDFYQRNSPFALARRNSNLAGLKIYFDCGRSDEYGFHAGAEALHRLLDSLKVPHEFHLYPGGHDWMYLADHLDDSFTFQSRAFASP